MSFQIGRTSTLSVLREVPQGWILGDPDRSVLLPKKEAPDGTALGDELEVFVHTDSEDRPIATTRRPLAQADEFACLEVVSVGQTGAFLDWGLPKDLLLPHRSQLRRLRPHESLVVRVLLDRVSQRPVASAKVEGFLEPPPNDLREGMAVDILVYERTELGNKAIVNGSFGGLLYAQPGEAEPSIGESRAAYIQRIRDDGKIDLTTRPSGKAGIDHARNRVLEALQQAGGRLELGDQSPPAEIESALGLSKKAFKRAIGGLYRERRIRIGQRWIEAAEPQDGASTSPPPSARPRRR